MGTTSHQPRPESGQRNNEWPAWQQGESQPIRVVAVDDHPFTLHGMQQLIGSAPGIEVVGTGTTREEALAVVRETEPDVVVFDLNLHGIREWRTIDEILSSNHHVKVIVISSISEEDAGPEALTRQRCGFLPKNLAARDVVAFIRDAVQKDKVAARRELMEYLTERRRGEQPNVNDLPTRQRQVLFGLAVGLTTKQIADHFKISINTVYEYSDRLRVRFNLDSLHDLRNFALDLRNRGLLNPPPGYDQDLPE